MKLSNKFVAMTLLLPGVAAFQPRHVPPTRPVSSLSYIEADDFFSEPSAIRDAVDGLREPSRTGGSRTSAIEPLGGFDRDASGNLIGSIYSGYQPPKVSAPRHGRSRMGPVPPKAITTNSQSERDVFTAQTIYITKPGASHHSPDRPFNDDVFTAAPIYVSKPAFAHPSHSPDQQDHGVLTAEPIYVSRPDSSDHSPDQPDQGVFTGEPIYISKSASAHRSQDPPVSVEALPRDVHHDVFTVEPTYDSKPAYATSDRRAFVEASPRDVHHDVFTAEPIYATKPVVAHHHPDQSAFVEASPRDVHKEVFTAEPIHASKPAFVHHYPDQTAFVEASPRDVFRRSTDSTPNTSFPRDEVFRTSPQRDHYKHAPIEPLGGFDRDAAGNLIGNVYSGYHTPGVSGPQHSKSMTSSSPIQNSDAPKPRRNPVRSTGPPMSDSTFFQPPSSNGSVSPVEAADFHREVATVMNQPNEWGAKSTPNTSTRINFASWSRSIPAHERHHSC